MKVPFALPDITKREVDAVAHTVASGWLTSGKVMKDFEKDFEELYFGMGAVAVNSATAGLHLVLEALGVRAGDEVVVPSMTFTATAEVVRYMGAIPVLCDVHPETGCLTLESIRAVQSDKTVGVIPVHFAGLAMDIEPITDYARRRGWFVVEDAAHAIGASFHGVPVGAMDSDATVFSFYATKCITTGEGGMVLSRDPRILQRIRVMRLHGIDRDAFNRYQSGKPAWEYDIIAPGFKYNMTDVAASMGRVQLSRMEEMRLARGRIALRYHDELPPDMQVVHRSMLFDERHQHAYHLYQIQVPARDEFIAAMFSKGVGCSVHFKPLHLMEYWARNPGSVRGRYLGAESRFSRLVSIPIYSAMTADQVAHVVMSVKEAEYATRREYC